LNLLARVQYRCSFFAEDRRIAINPSIFGGPAARSRSTVPFWLRNPRLPDDFVKGNLAREVWAILSMQPDGLSDCGTSSKKLSAPLSFRVAVVA
jgi:hypothetical protein